MSTTHSTPVRTVESRTGMIFPATVDQHTEMNDIPCALSTYQRLNGRRVAWDTLMRVGEAMRDSSAVIVLYTDAKGEVAARCLCPSAITLTKDNQITARCYCTLRREYRSFRLDRVIACHELTTPDDCEA
jgi:predicted DNA-binding transcriptional regulator YafY